MDISGFGPFAGPIKIAMNGNGFTLVSGECNATHSASNGAGKSMATAGAWLWACTGQIDGRGSLLFDGDTSIIHNGSEKAEVTVSGTVDGSPWKIMRSLQDKKHSIRLFLNHEERTRSTLSGTQRAIATELFGLDLKGQLHQWLFEIVWSQQSVASGWTQTTLGQVGGPFAGQYGRVDIFIFMGKAKCQGYQRRVGRSCGVSECSHACCESGR